MEKVADTLNREKLTKAMNGCIEWIRDFFEKNGKGCNAVLGISGGKDSSVAAAILVEALGKDRVIGVLMPNGEQADIDMAYKLVNHLGIKHYVVNIKDAFEGIVNAFPEDLKLSEQSRINLGPRLRMSTVYAVSQSVNGRVANTCNLSEDWVGYSTRYGDSVGDFSPLSHFTVQEVKEIGSPRRRTPWRVPVWREEGPPGPPARRPPRNRAAETAIRRKCLRR